MTETLNEIINSLRNLILTMSVWDLVDIVIIAFIIYKLLMFVRKTNSINVVKGIGFLVLILWLSSLLQLSVISYLLGKTFELGVLALIVLFQPEIRRLFEQMGNSNFRGFFSIKSSTYEDENVISQIVSACEDLSSTKTGALIAIERSNSLESYINTGTNIDAKPASELFKNIFYPKSPLHDGAVIIRNGRVAAAACMLPLTSNANLDSELGMRHRAGVGMSERSDAVVIIVSEETGAISVAIHGMLKRHLSAETFLKLLKNELMPEDETSRKKRLRFIMRKGGK